MTSHYPGSKFHATGIETFHPESGTGRRRTDHGRTDRPGAGPGAGTRRRRHVDAGAGGHGRRRAGRRRTRGRRQPDRPGAARAAAALADAVGQALSGLDPAAVRYVVLGLAGGAALPSGEDMPAGEAFARVWERAGLSCPVEYQGDALIAFVAGTDRPEGSLLLSGTGAVAIAVKDRAMAARSDGHGWLLGDRGSGFWLGRQAVVAAMAELDGEGPPTVLTGLVIESLSLGGAVPGTESASVFPEGAAPVPASPPPPPPPPPPAR
ncbi:BadF/BadG/BcrA/BcrD ATPase family protein [Catenulispora yoronensis]